MKVKDFYELFAQTNNKRRRRNGGLGTTKEAGNEGDEGLGFPAIFRDVTLSKPKISGTRDVKGNSELAATGMSFFHLFFNRISPFFLENLRTWELQ